MSVNVKTPFIRLFEYSEIVQNFEWPDEVGLAVVVRDGKIVRMQPYHDGEDPTGVVEHLQALEQAKYPEDLSVYPKLDGYPEIDMGFSEDIVLLSGIEAALNLPDSELREETENFVVNFQFARDMGIAMPHAATPPEVELVEDTPPQAPPSEVSAPIQTVAHQPIAPTVPQGFVPLDNLAPVPACFKAASYRQSTEGEAVLEIAGKGSSVTLTHGDILVRTDRTGFAIPARAYMVNGQPVSSIKLPAGMIPETLSPLGATVYPVVSQSSGLLFCTFSGGPAVSKSHKLLAGLFAAYFIATLAFFGFWASGSFMNSDNPEGTVDALRNELFK